ncbi:unnamed protein product [Dicrocoelium dendriticum]|nr:unnamed protein product [Dicrocoelium dendriticum]
MFNPWFRLLLAIRPLLKIQRTEEELYFLRSELERYKTLVKMLRFENAEYQAKVANLLQLIEQINTKGSESATVNELVQQISESLAKNQDFWQEMAAGNKALQSSALARPDCSTNTRSSPMLVPSPLTQLKRDADFYRNQVEMLKEEADEQQHRSSEHFQGQVSVLSDRVEQLQHLLSLEHDKVSRLSSELEGMNKTILEAKSHERSLEQTVSQLSRQLEQRDRAQAHEIKDVLRTADSPLTISDRNVDSEIQRDLERKLASYRRMIGELRAHLAKSPKAMHALANTPFQPGGEMDLFREPISVESGYTSVEPKLDQKFFAYPVQSEHESYASGGSTTPRSAFVQENAELKRQLAASENLLAETMEKMKNELEDREALESENKELNDRIAALNRQIRHKEEEYDEMINRKDVVCQRKLKELADQLEEETRAKSRLIQQTKELEKELTELRNVAEPDEDILNEEWETMRSKMRIDLAHYKRALEIVQDEYDQFRREHDPSVVHKQLAEKDERISLLEQEGQQRRTELEVLQVRLQNANSLLEESENRLKASIRERTAQQHRLTLVETERDEAIRKAANIEGRASAERENIASKLREIEELRVERDGLRRELMEVKQTLAGCQAETAADKRQLQVRLREMETYNEARITDFKAELDRAREELERLQLELQTVQASELEQKASNQQYRWKINELEDQLSHSLRRVSTLERRNTDLDAELTRAKADLSTSREVASLRKASQTRFAEEWLQYVGSEDTEDEDLNASFGDENSPLNSRVRRCCSRSTRYVVAILKAHERSQKHRLEELSTMSHSHCTLSASSQSDVTSWLNEIHKRRTSVGPSATEFNFAKCRVRVLKGPNLFPEFADNIGKTPGGVLYWMIRDQRVQDNWAFLYAQRLAMKFEVPLHACFCLVPHAQANTLRHFTFMIDGLAELEKECRELHIQFHLLTIKPHSLPSCGVGMKRKYSESVEGGELFACATSQAVCDLVQKLNIGCVLTDVCPLREPTAWVDALTKCVPQNVPVCQVDAHNVVPVWYASDKLEYAARTIRRKLHDKAKELWTEFPPLVSHPYRNENNDTEYCFLADQSEYKKSKCRVDVQTKLHTGRVEKVRNNSNLGVTVRKMLSVTRCLIL